VNNIANMIRLVVVLALALSGCGAKPTAPLTAVTPSPTAVQLSHTQTPFPQGKNITVTSAADSGSVTLRQALLDAQPGDTITFDSNVFPPENPTVIKLMSGLPSIYQGYLTLDVSNAGVILDGSQAGEGWIPGIIIESEHNIIQGLQVIHFSGPGILLNSSARFNLVGGDRSIGSGPLGQGNLFSDTSDGVGILGSDNTVTGNLIGTDITGLGKLGNKAPGVFLDGNASRNVIGPNNIIAYNGTVGGGGVEIRSVNALANVITANSIHDNSFSGIYYNISNGAQAVLTLPPVILDFDLAAGLAKGIVCPYCSVELFSTSARDGEEFEGSATADQYGDFSITKDQAFAGPALTATSRSADSNTSAFSAPTSELRRSLTLQEQNDTSRSLLSLKPSDELADNRIGSLWSDFWQSFDFQEVIDNEIVPAGLKWVKISMNQAEYITSDQSGVVLFWDKPELFISPEFDSYIDQLVSHKITIYYMLNFWDKANHPNGWSVQYRFTTEEDIAHYLEYVRFIVTHFKGRVQYYELWNEPNIRVPLQYINPEDYINLAKRTIPVIKEIDPQAKVVVGCTSNTANTQPRDYLFNLLNSDLMPIADAVSWHPFYGAIPNSGKNPDYYASYPALLASLIDTAKQNGFQGEFIAAEMSYGGSTCGGCDVIDPSYSDTIWAKYTARAILLHLGNDVAAGININSQRTVHYNTIRNIDNVFAGIHAEEFDVEVQPEPDNLMNFSFTGSDGSKLVALWTNGVAVDDDPGFSSTISIPGVAGWNASVIDILNGLEQKLIASNENGSLVIRGLLIKDYPVIIRLTE